MINEASVVYAGSSEEKTPLDMEGEAKKIMANDANIPGVQFMNPTGTGNPIIGDANTSQTDVNNASSIFYQNTNKTQQNSPIGESRFSKRQVELGRMLEMRRTGKVFSKKQLNEMFMETQENADRLRQGIGNCRLHDIFDAIEEIFPEEIDGVKEAFMNGADLPEYICSIFSNDDVNGEKEEMFLERLGI